MQSDEQLTLSSSARHWYHLSVHILSLNFCVQSSKWFIIHCTILRYCVQSVVLLVGAYQFERALETLQNDVLCQRCVQVNKMNVQHCLSYCSLTEYLTSYCNPPLVLHCMTWIHSSTGSQLFNWTRPEDYQWVTSQTQPSKTLTTFSIMHVPYWGWLSLIPRLFPFPVWE